MSNYSLNSQKKQKIINITIDKSYIIENKKDYKKIVIYEDEKIKCLAEKSLNKQYKKLLNFLNENNNADESGTENFQVCLDKIEKFKQILEVKYCQLIKKQLYKEYLKSIINLSKYFQYKIIEYNEINLNNYQR